MVSMTIKEANYTDLVNKQKSITDIRPDFADRVDAVAEKGGVRLAGMEPGVWRFKMHSGTKDDVWYDGAIHFKNLREVIAKHIPNNELWTKDGQHVNLIKLAKVVFQEVQMQIVCSCFIGDTQVPLLDGRTLTLEQITNEFGQGEFWVYASDENGDFVPAKAHSLGITNYVNELIEITLDNDKTVTCTRDQLFRLRDGSYQRADELTEGLALLPLYTKNTKPSKKYSQSYTKVLINSRRAKNHKPIWRTVHRIVAEKLVESKCTEKISVVHHKDYNSKNNTPENLIWLGKQEHWELHAHYCKDNCIAGIKKAWQDPEFRKINSKKNARAGKICIEKHPELVDQFNKKGIAYKKSKKGRAEASETMKQSWKSGKLKPNQGIKHTEQTKEKMKQAWTEERRSKIQRDSNGRFNHKIKSIRIITTQTPVPVYDLSMDNYNNFAIAAGVYVHNCPDFKYGGFDYILSQAEYDAKYGEPEHRSPDIRNPKKKGSFCFDERAKVLTADGVYKSINEVVVGDLVITHTGEAHKVIRTFSHRAETIEVGIEGMFSEFSVTPQHEFYIRGINDKCLCGCGHKFTRTKISETNYGINKLNSRITKKCHKTREYKLEDQTNSLVWEKVKNLDRRHLLYCPKPLQGYTEQDLRIARLIGYFAAEGSFSNHPTTCYKQPDQSLLLDNKAGRASVATGLHFALNVQEKNTIARDIIKLCKATVPETVAVERIVNYKRKSGTTTNYLALTITDKQRAIVKTILDYIDNYKNLNSIVFEWCDDAKLEFLLGIFLGDGYIGKRGNCSIALSNYKLACQIHTILTSVGIKANLKSYKSTNQTKDFIGTRHIIMFYLWDLPYWFTGECIKLQKTNAKHIERPTRHFRTNGLCYQLNGILRFFSKINKTKVTNRQVFNLEVENDNSYIVNGVVVHNCKHLHAMFTTLPWYNDTMAAFMRDYYTEEVRQLENQVKQQQPERGEEELAQRQVQQTEEPFVKEPSEEETKSPWYRPDWMNR